MAEKDKIVNLEDLKYVNDKIGDLKSNVSDVSEATRNLWTFGDLTGTKGVMQKFNFISGTTYIISCKITSDYSGSNENSRVAITNNLSVEKVVELIKHDGERHSCTITATDDCTKIIFYASNTSSHSEGCTVTVTDIQIETGSETAYIPPLSASDYIERENRQALASNISEALSNHEEAIDRCNESMLNALGARYEYNDVETSADSSHGNGKYWKITTDEQTGVSSASVDSSVNYYAYNPIPVSAGDHFKITINQASSTAQDPVLVVDSNYIILSRYRSGSIGVKNFDVDVDTDGAYILLTTAKTTTEDTAVKKRVGYLSDALKGLSEGLYNFRNKTVAIIGDSVSTNGDYDPDTNPYGNVPEIIITEDDVGTELSAYLTKKDVDGGLSLGGQTFTSSQIGTEVTFTPVDGDVGKMIGKPINYNASSVATWWEIVQELAHFTTIPVCWSGASMTSHEGSKDLYKTSYAWHDATIRKCGIRTPGESSASSARTAPDVVIIFRGVNDLSHPESQSADPLVFRARAKVTEGEIGAYPGTYPETDKAGTSGAYKYGLAEAIEITVKKLREAYPHTMVVLCTINSFIRLDVETYPMNNGINTLPEYNETIRKVANVMGCPLIEFDKDGITFENVSDYTVDLTHPNAAGHAILAKRAMIDLAKINEFAVD